MINASPRSARPPRRPLPPRLRIAAAIFATAGFALPVAAYASSPSPTRAATPPRIRAFALSRSTNAQKALAYSRCMRSHGVPSFPDPSSSGALPKVSQQQLDDPQFQAAQRACQDLLPAGTNDQFPPGEVQQLLVGMVRFSKCMRSHGLPNWPDPATDAQGRPYFPLSAAGFSRQQARSSLVTRAGNACRHLLPAALGGIPVG
jgi:hypothetical protein